MRCLNDGTLLAFLDTELDEAAQRRTAGHLQECVACRARCDQLKNTAARVDRLLNCLEAPESTAQTMRPFVPRPAAARLGWGAVALAFAVLILAVLIQRPKPAAPATVPSNANVMAGFMPLDDDDPVQIGVVVRMKVSPAALGFSTGTSGVEQVTADVVIGEDGRARAIRFLE